MRKSNFFVVGAVIVFAVSLVFTPASGTAAEGGSQVSPPILDNLPPTWSRALPANLRFELVLNGAAVLDKETGLVWQQSPYNSLWTYQGARAECNLIDVGGRMGWHLPTVEQLTSLIDRTSTSGKMVPDGHPFGLIWGRYPYWTASPYPGAPWAAYQVNFVTGEVAGAPMYMEYHVWCVRGGQSHVGEPLY
ncbi:DUF1566 domain-containing protein [Geomonas oryzisoli]|uniref:DUF1566 domain-containing protein n=1 Tax=Geomonas oryzisoli TaxID=2847992 RepID=A0ABX8JBW0_9BACT|nr:DUF1566 domain-containing protein [Geomonas oryzisoli]QWV94212.1 DUF1566 domain-containing protein [Geomonas oryzisoli]